MKSQKDRKHKIDQCVLTDIRFGPANKQWNLNNINPQHWHLMSHPNTNQKLRDTTRAPFIIHRSSTDIVELRHALSLTACNS